MQDNTALELVRHMCHELETAKVSYCHWKSNAMLHRSASGENDLDLLVKRTDAQRFTQLLYELGFRKVQAVPELRTPGIEHFYGYDSKSERFVHVHAHYQLIVGADLLKQHRLRIERVLLESAIKKDLFKIPAPELEFIIFVIRMVLKRPVIGRRKHQLLPASACQELEYLISCADPEQTTLALEENFPYLDSRLFNACVQSLQPTSSTRKRLATSWQLRRAMRTIRCRSWIESILLKGYRRLVLALRSRLFKFASRKRLVHGGMLIAVVGGDGAGKSTAVDGLRHWLEKDIDTIAVHMGKPPRSAVTFAVDNLLRFNHLIELIVRRQRKDEYWTSTETSTHLGPLEIMRCVCTARDRFKAYTRVQRFTSNGGIGICDRYPVPQIKRMDSRRLEHLEHGTGLLYQSLARLERRHYDQILPPDLLIVLKVSPDIAVKRKTEESANSVQMRSQEVWELDWRQINAHVIDASRPQKEVLTNLKSLVWSNL